MPNYTTTTPFVTQLNVGGVEIARITYRGEPVITFAEIDRLHLRKADTASRAFRDNRERFTEGVDVVSPTSDEIRGMSDAEILPERTARVTFLTRRGYLKIVKVLSDDRAWDVQGEMIERFFAFERSAPALPNFSDPATAARAWAEQYEARLLAERTKAEIGSRREATAMNTASQAVRRADQLAVELDRSREYATLKRMSMIYHGQKFDWRKLKSASAEMDVPAIDVFDQNYGTVKAYHVSVWREVYALEITAPTNIAQRKIASGDAA